ncbi:hypothetical protein B0H10DRAFT_2112089, partial [Mycena sp. CBHHK59/15]
MPTEPKASTGPPQALIYRIEHLQQLLKHLPSSLPLDPAESLYQFYEGEDRVANAGTVFPVAGRALELSFGTWERDAVVKFTERGSRVTALGPFLKNVVKRMTPSERVSFEKAWIGRLLQAAKDSGAPPAKKNRVDTRASPDSDDNNNNTHPPPSIHSSFGLKQTIAPNTVILSTAAVDLKVNTQATLATMGWQKWVPGAKEAHQKAENQLHRECVASIMEEKESWGLHGRGDFERRSRRRRRQRKRV